MSLIYKKMIPAEIAHGTFLSAYHKIAAAAKLAGDKRLIEAELTRYTEDVIKFVGTASPDRHENYHRAVFSGGHVERLLAMIAIHLSSDPALAQSVSHLRDCDINRIIPGFCECENAGEGEINEAGDIICPSCGAVNPPECGKNPGGAKAERRGRSLSILNMLHVRGWLTSMQAMDNSLPDPAKMEILRAAIEADRVGYEELDCYKMREYLKQCRCTDMNKFVPSLICQFTGRAPPVLSYNEIEEICARYRRIMEIAAGIGDPEITFSYYPYPLRKICEHMFRDQPEKLEIIRYLCLQRPDTTIACDKVFRRICDAAAPGDDLVYRPTHLHRYNHFK